VKDPARQARDCQFAALRAFNLGDLHTAYPLYLEAEAHYRAAFPPPPGDRVFFMQASAVRCLGELIEQRPALSELYGNEANRCLAEWTQDTIKARVSSRHVEEALSFRSWIKSNFEGPGSNIFYDANLAVEAGNFEEAEVLLDKTIGDLTESAHPERDAILAIARSKREMLVAKEEIMKRRVDRDPRKVAWAWLRAAKASCLPAQTSSTQADILSRHRYVALSEALKWRAVKSLNQQRTSNEVRQKSLEDAERFLRRAVNYPRTAHSKGRGDKVPAAHDSRLAYSYQTVRERLALMRFMLTGDDQHFDIAIQAWAEALKIANTLSEKKATLFPHRFYSLKDLELEELFLNAARAFRNAQWADCVAFLQKWINNFPIEYRWSWRYSNVLVRLLGASVIAKICSGNGQLDRGAVRQQIRDLDNVARTEPIGPAGRYFADEIVRLEGKSAAIAQQTILQHLYPYFPLDSSVDFYGRPAEIDPFQSLSSRIHRGLCLPTATTPTQLEMAKVEFFASVEALLGYVCDYDAQWSPTRMSLPEPSICGFLRFCEQFGWATKPPGKQLLNQLEAVIAHCEAAATAKEFATLYEQGRQIVRQFLYLAPLRVSLKSRFDSIEQQDYTDAAPDWCLDRTERKSIRISVKSEALLPIEPGEYYLPPPWRTGTRLFYLVDPDDNNPLFPVRFEPRWDYWDQAALFSLPGGERPLVITEGKTDWQHLKRALAYFKAQGEYQDLDVDFLEFADPETMGDQKLLQICENAPLLKPKRKFICVFDRDNTKIITRMSDASSQFRKVGHNVYSFCIPVPDHRSGYSNITIESYYLDADLRTTDPATGKRLWFSNEIEMITHPTSSQKEYRTLAAAREQEEYDKFVFDQPVNKIVNAAGQSVGLSKAAFVTTILDNPNLSAGFERGAFCNIFNIVRSIVTPVPIPQAAPNAA
jgi:hypothetical protein